MVDHLFSNRCCEEPPIQATHDCHKVFPRLSLLSLSLLLIEIFHAEIFAVISTGWGPSMDTSIRCRARTLQTQETGCKLGYDSMWKLDASDCKCICWVRCKCFFYVGFPWIWRSTFDNSVSWPRAALLEMWRHHPGWDVLTISQTASNLQMPWFKSLAMNLCISFYVFERKSDGKSDGKPIFQRRIRVRSSAPSMLCSHPPRGSDLSDTSAKLADQKLETNAT